MNKFLSTIFCFLFFVRLGEYLWLIIITVSSSSLWWSGDSIRCYQCRSDQLSDCGDPFYAGRVPSTECDNYNTQQTFTCYKVSTYGKTLIIINHHWSSSSWLSVVNQYITVRGCAPFNKDYFPINMQRGLAGDYWNVSWYSVVRELS